MGWVCLCSPAAVVLHRKHQPAGHSGHHSPMCDVMWVWAMTCKT
jgi:hypothetical protein